MDIGQGTGLASATGVRPFLPPLLAGALARGDHGIDFEGTSYAFLEETWFLAVVLGLAVAWYVAERSGPNSGAQRAASRALFPIAGVFGALLFAGSLEAGGHEGWWGLPLGAAVAVVSRIALGGLFDRAMSRLDENARGLLPVLADFLSLVMAFASLLLGLLGFLVFLGLLPLLRGTRGGDDEKYAGLRVLK